MPTLRPLRVASAIVLTAWLLPAAAHAQVYALECQSQSPTTVREYSAVATPCLLERLNDTATAVTSTVTVTVGGAPVPVDGLAVDSRGRLVAFELPSAAGPGSRMVVIDPRTGAATRASATLDFLVYGAGFDLDDRLWVAGVSAAPPMHNRVFSEVDATSGAQRMARPMTGDLSGRHVHYIPAMDVAALPQGGLAVLDSDEVAGTSDRVFAIDPATARTTLLRGLDVPASVGGYSLGMTFTNRHLFAQALVFDGNGTDDILLASLCARAPTDRVLLADTNPQNAGFTDLAAVLRPSDDDGDGVQSRFERTLTDSPCAAQRDIDRDGLPDYLDPDDDGDGVATALEAPDPNGDGDPADARDTDRDGVADWLDNKDLVASLVEPSLRTDPQRLTAVGDVTVVVRNQGLTPVTGRFTVTVFRDVNRDGRFRPADDVALGTGTSSDPIAPGAVARVGVTGIAATLAFRDEPVFAWVDSGEAVAESREDNNVGRSGSACTSGTAPPLAAVNLREEWSYTMGSSASIVAAADLEGDGSVELVVPLCPNRGAPDTDYLEGTLRVFEGRSGRLLRSSASADLNAGSTIAIGDIDRDGRAEIIALDRNNRVVAFEDDLRVKWTSAAIPLPPGLLTGALYAAPGIADLDGDGNPEVFVGATVLSHEGRILWTGSAGRGYPQRTAGGGYAVGSVAADIDLDGRQELVAGNTAYRADGSILWSAAVPDGMTAVGNFDADPYPEVVVASAGRVSLLDHEGSIVWRTVHPGSAAPAPLGNGATFLGILGAPVIANVDGDPAPEIGVAGSSRFVMFDTNGAVLWQATTNDSSAATGATAFDFDGDGRLELVYSDEFNLFVWNGADGRELLRRPFHNATALAYPTVADVDSDGSAEILLATYSGFAWIPRMQNGLYVFGPASGRWRGAREIVNQQPYDVNNVSDARGTIPRRPFPAWLDHNTHRCQQPSRAVGGANPDGLADVTASFLRVDLAGLPAVATVTARVGNAGLAPVAAGTSVTFYTGDPRAAATARVGTVTLAAPLLPGAFVDLSIPWRMPPSLRGVSLWVAVDDDGSTRGSLTGAVVECNERNNEHSLPLDDADGDGVPDALDADDDDDGLPDALEGNGRDPSADHDGDGLPDARDRDFPGFTDGNADGVDDRVDADRDGVANHLDLDADGDGIMDLIEADHGPLDADRDGRIDRAQGDNDRDGLATPVDRNDRDAAVTDRPRAPPDTDGSGGGDWLDLDADGDSLPDAVEGHDVDADGRADRAPARADSDGDGLDDAYDATARGMLAPLPDHDTDRTPDWRDLDDDGDSIPTAVEERADTSMGSDLDADRRPSSLDEDSDGDGDSDREEAGADGTVPADTDRDGAPDFLDRDADNDCAPDSDPREAGGARVDARVPAAMANANCPLAMPVCDTMRGVCGSGMDADGDGLFDEVERRIGTDPANPDSDGDGVRDGVEVGDAAMPRDTDGDGMIDARDPDDDGDTIPTRDERPGDADRDGDMDGLPDHRDPDDDGDTIPTAVERRLDTSTGGDLDADMAPSWRDTDSDGDGVADREEAGLDPAMPVDTDRNGAPDFLDRDADNDCAPDSAMSEQGAARVTPAPNPDAACGGDTPVCDRTTGRCVAAMRPDAAVLDAPTADVGPDAAMDAPLDVGPDAAMDAPLDVAMDASPDAPDASPPLVIYRGGGCGCRAPGAADGGSYAPTLTALAALLALARRRRPARR